MPLIPYYPRRGVYARSRYTRPMIKHRMRQQGYSRGFSSRRRFRAGYDRTGGRYGRYNRGIGGVIKPELKSRGNPISVAAISVVGDVASSSLVVIAENTSSVGRIGRKCTIVKISFNWSLSIPGFESQPDPRDGDAVRMMLIQDLQCNGTAAIPSQILASTDYQSFRNLNETHRFKVLYDKTVVLNYTSLSTNGANDFSSGGVTRNGSWFKNVNIPILYNGISGLLATIRSNNLLLIVTSREGDAGIVGQIRVRYSDA